MNTPSAENACPHHGRLLDLAEGRLAERDAESIALHVAGCKLCDAQLDWIEDQSDYLVQALTGFPANENDEAEFQALQEKLLANPEAFSDRTDALTITELRDAGQDSLQLSFAPMETSLPIVLGNYKLLELIGSGAHGAVFRARHQRLDREVAVKLLLRARGPHVEEFLNEMRIVGKLDHPNIVRASDAGEVDGVYFLAMDYVPGIDVSSLLRRTGPLNVADACEITRQAALGLAFAHDHQLVHRDVKTSNLLFAANGLVKLLDLGLATIPPQSSVSGTQATSNPLSLDGPRGTADYMAPEQWQQASRVSEKADIYSLGCTLFKLLTSEPPFRVLPAGIDNKRVAHETLEPSPLAKYRTDVPQRLERLMRQMLAKSANARPISAEYVARQLSGLAETSDLRRLMREYCPELPNLPLADQVRTATSPLAQVRRLASRVPRRTWLIGGASLIAASSLLMYTSPDTHSNDVKTGTWRDLTLARPRTIRQKNAVPARVSRTTGDRLQLNGDGLTLLHLGSPIVRPFRWQTELRSITPKTAETGTSAVVSESPGRLAGVFFGLRRTHNENWAFYAVELLASNSSDDGRTATLLWSKYSEPASQVSTPIDTSERPTPEELEVPPATFTERIDLAQTRSPIPMELPANTQLELSLGRSAFPVISLNGSPLPEHLWHISNPGRQQINKGTHEVAELYSGHIGVIHHRGITRIESSRLLYF